MRDERGFAMIGALLVIVLVTALGSAAIFLSQMDLTLAGNYRAQRTAEVAADGAVDLVKAMIYGNEPQLNLSLGIPTDGTAATWHQDTTYADADVDVAISIRYKQEDTINHNTVELYPDEVVRYGKDYNYDAAQKDVGKQPVFTVTVRDTKSGVKGETDLVSTIGFRTPAALFCGGRVHMQNYQWATEESIEVTSGAGTPAVATALSNASGNITLETVRESTTFLGTTTLTAAPAAGAATLTVVSTTGFPAAGQVLLRGALVSYTARSATQFTGCTGVPAADVGNFVNITSGGRTYNADNSSGTTGITYAVNPSYLHPRVYRPSEVALSRTAGLYNQARESAHLLLGIGDRNADLTTAYHAAGGGSAGATAANALFRFYNPAASDCSSNPHGTNCTADYDAPVAFAGSPPTCSGIVCFGYTMPAAQAPLTQLETMFGQSFADLKSLADQELTCTATVSLPSGGSSSNGCNLSGVSLGTTTAPQVVFINGTGNGNPVTLVTNAGTQVSGFGILVIDDDAEIVGSINWRGLMLIRGDLTFRPWQGGTAAARSGPELATQWNGFIIIGGNLDLWTYWGGSIILGYNTAEMAAIKGIISSTVPHKVLTWRRMYN